MPPRIELITTGTELLDTRVNHHAVSIGGSLKSAGLALIRQTSVPDGPELEPILRDTIHRADVTLVTGGLGPTTDDLTRETTARILGLPLHLDESVADHIRDYFQRRGRDAPDFVFRQAMVPEGGAVLPNPSGTAPGLKITYGGNLVFLLPGPPRELLPMWADHVLPEILRSFPPDRAFASRVVSVAGMAESEVQSRTESVLAGMMIAELGYCAHPGIVDIRMRAQAADLESAAQALQAEFQSACFTTIGESLPEAVIRDARQKNQRLVTAESCTGGLAAQRLIRIAGASDVVDRAWITYCDEAKTECLGVPADLIEEVGAVSEPVAAAMAHGALDRSRADVAISITGIAGPSGGTEDKPVGTVWFGRALRDGNQITTQTRHAVLPPDRITFQDIASTYALNWLREAIMK